MEQTSALCRAGACLGHECPPILNADMALVTGQTLRQHWSSWPKPSAQYSIRSGISAPKGASAARPSCSTAVFTRPIPNAILMTFISKKIAAGGGIDQPWWRIRRTGQHYMFTMGIPVASDGAHNLLIRRCGVAASTEGGAYICFWQG